MKPSGNIDAVIAELQNKRDELDRAIIDLMKLRGSGLLQASISPAGVRVKVKGKSAYKLAVKALEANRKPLAMAELTGLVLQAGYTSKSKEPHKIVNTSLYKAIAGKKGCDLVIMKDQKIGLKGWK